GFDSAEHKFAVKQIMKDKLTKEQLRSLKDEVKIMLALKSEHVVRLYATMQTKTHYYLVMEYCGGGDLDRLQGKKLSERIVQRIVHQLGKGLKVLFDNGIVHRDLKLSNLLLSSKKQDAMLKLADFGVAKRLRENERTKSFCGTPLYMAPEILAG
ncbi:MAG: protein kinase, partial [Candidatus Pacebacteria bacterium]|nr:protein kinase [Candidatus Paceibacterota bacterium]